MAFIIKLLGIYFNRKQGLFHHFAMAKKTLKIIKLLSYALSFALLYPLLYLLGSYDRINPNLLTGANVASADMPGGYGYSDDGNNCGTCGERGGGFDFSPYSGTDGPDESAGSPGGGPGEGAAGSAGDGGDM